MTVAATEPAIKYNYSGPGTYTFAFRIFEDDNLTVTLTDTDGVVTPLVLGTDYSVNINVGSDGGNIVATPVATTGTLEIRRVLPITQEVDWVNNDPFDMDTLEFVQDKMTMILQQMDVTVTDGTQVSTWRGDWLTGTVYSARDMIVDPVTNNMYVCLVEHTSGTFATDLASGMWSLAMDVQAVTDAANAAAASAAAALVSETNAAASETAADASETNSADSEATALAASINAANCAAEAFVSAAASAASAVVANNFSDYPEDSEIPGYPGEYSAYHWAKKSEASAGAVSTVTASGTTPITVDNTDPNNPIVGGLDHVDNTADVNKPVSVDQQLEIDTKEDDLGNPTSDGDVLSSTIAGARSWITPASGGGGGGPESFITGLLPHSWREALRTGWTPHWFNQQHGGTPYGDAYEEVAASDIAPNLTASVGSTSVSTDQALRFSVGRNITSNKLKLKLGKVGNPTDDFEVEIWSDSAGAPGSVIANGAATLISCKTLASEPEVTEVHFPTSFTLTADTDYYIYMSRSTGIDASNYPTFIYSSTSKYPNARRFRWDTSTWIDAGAGSGGWFQIIPTTSSADGTFTAYEGAPLNQSGALTRPIRELTIGDTFCHTEKFESIEDGKPLMDMIYGLEQDRVLLTVVSGVLVLKVFSADGTKLVVTGSTTVTGLDKTVGVVVNPTTSEIWVNGVEETTTSYDPEVELLIHSNTTEGSTTFTDSSTNGATINANGDVHHTTAIHTRGISSIAFDGTGDYLGIAGADMPTLIGDFTIEMNCALVGNISHTVYAQGYSIANSVMLQSLNSLYLKLYAGNTGSVTSSIPLTGTPQHVAIVRAGDTMKLYISGVEACSITYLSSISPFNTGIGASPTGSFPINGNIEEIQITQRAKWLSDFTPPTPMYPLDIDLGEDFKDKGNCILGGGMPEGISWTKETLMSDLPSADGWTYNGTATEANAFSVAGGKLYQNKLSSQNAEYTIATPLVNATGWIYSARLSSLTDAVDDNKGGVVVDVTDDTYRLLMYVHPDGLRIYDGSSYISRIARYKYNKLAEINIFGKGDDYYIFINGVLVFDGTGLLPDVAATSYIKFGDTSLSADYDGNAVWDYIRYADSWNPPEYTSASISDLGFFSANISDKFSDIHTDSMVEVMGIPELPTVERGVEVKGIEFAPSTTSGTLVGFPDMDQFVLGESIYSSLVGNLYNSNSAAACWLSLGINGDENVTTNANLLTSPGVNWSFLAGMEREEKVNFGMQFISGHWATSAGTLTTNYDSRRLITRSK